MRPKGSQGSTRPCSVAALEADEITHSHRSRLHAKALVRPTGVKDS